MGATGKILTLSGHIEQLQTDITTIEGKIADIKRERAERLQLRNEEVAEFRQAMKDDSDAVIVLDQAMVAMREFYRRNKLPLALKAEPEYTTDKDKAPETI